MDILSENIDVTNESYLKDEAGLIKGYANKIFFPKTEEEIINIFKQGYKTDTPITISGGGTGLSGGRVPLGGWILATDNMVSIQNGDEWTDNETMITYRLHMEKISDDYALLTVPVAMTVKAIENFARKNNWYYPPDPTERSSFIGGNVSTNASGARSFKYGATRDWVERLRIITPMGHTGEIHRDNKVISSPIKFIFDNHEYSIPRPDYKIPNTSKNVAGPVLTNKSELIDLFIGTGGLFGVVTEITIRLIRPPKNIINMFVYCNSIDQAIKLISILRNQKEKNTEPIPLSVEYIDDRGVKIIQSEDKNIPDAAAMIILEQEFSDDEQMDSYLTYYMGIFDTLEIEDTAVAQNYKEIEYHRFLRHSLPETVNAMTRRNSQPKLGTDYAVPFKRFSEFMHLAIKYGELFEIKCQADVGYIIWAHAGDAHIHLNFLPSTQKETNFAKSLMVKLMMEVVNMNGTIAAEHGLGKKEFEGKPALYYQLGDKGLEQIKQMKLAMDPKNILNRGNLFKT